MNLIKTFLLCSITALAGLSTFPANAFCGFYAGKADASLFNEASQVVVARDGKRTVLSMLNDYKGPLSEFVLVVPTPHKDRCESPTRRYSNALTPIRVRAWRNITTMILASLILTGVWRSWRLVWFDYAWDPGAAMWLQQISNGATLLFAFFMISDPMTTPQHRVARLCYVCLVATSAFVWQFVLFKPHGLIVALFLCSWSVPFINWLWPKARFAWSPSVKIGAPI